MMTRKMRRRATTVRMLRTERIGRQGTVFRMDGEDAVRPQIQTEGRGRREQSRGVKVVPMGCMLKRCIAKLRRMMIVR